jgi:hypothetical protein
VRHKPIGKRSRALLLAARPARREEVPVTCDERLVIEHYTR